MSLNQSASRLCELAIANSNDLRLASHVLHGGGRVIDFGCEVPGGIQAGLLLARICMASRAEISIAPADRSVWPGPMVQVTTDHPCQACMGSQYAGWKISAGDFFAMGSGPMRAKRGLEAVLEKYSISDSSPLAIGVLECETIPGDDVISLIAEACGTEAKHVTLCVAPTKSIAGVIQVVARSIETAMHKLFELGFDLGAIVSGHGTAPMPPVAKDFVIGIGRTNDAILYGGHVTLWVESHDDLLREIGPKIPSCASRDYGKPFAQTFKEFGFDFYQVDPGLFAPAVVTFINMRSGNSFRFGSMNIPVLQSSFGEALG